jgi:cobalt/nickel transport system permease protein
MSAGAARQAAGAGRGRRPAQGYLARSLAGITGAFEQTLFAEEIAQQTGLLQSLDPRAKLAGALALLLAISLSRSLPVIAALYLLTLPLAAASRVPMGFYLKRVWLFMPFFTGIIALPAIFSVFTPGPPLLVLVDDAPRHLYLAVTRPGVVTAAFLLLRVATSVAVALLLVLTTRWAVLLRALRVLHVPKAFVLILGMTYRYIFLLLQTANHMFLARRSRLVGRLSPAEDRRWIAGSAGTLLSKSYALSEDVYLAMQSRGFRGEVQALGMPAWQARDSAALVLALAMAALAVWLGR